MNVSIHASKITTVRFVCKLVEPCTKGQSFSQFQSLVSLARHCLLTGQMRATGRRALVNIDNISFNLLRFNQVQVREVLKRTLALYNFYCLNVSSPFNQ